MLYEELIPYYLRYDLMFQKDLNTFQKGNLSKHIVNFTMRCVPSQMKGGSHYVLSWG